MFRNHSSKLSMMLRTEIMLNHFGDVNEMVFDSLANRRTGIPWPQRQKAKLMEDEREITAGLLSKGASFRLIVTGRVGEKEIERLIKKLELDKEILADASNDDVAGQHPILVIREALKP
jgi:hypothetical protein